MPNFATIMLGLLVAWFLGYEIGKWTAIRQLKAAVKDMADNMTKATEKLKEQHKEEKSK